MDGRDMTSVGEAVAAARPDAIVHEMTGLSVARNGKANFRHPERFAATTNRLRTVGTDHLLVAGRAVTRSQVLQLVRADQPTADSTHALTPPSQTAAICRGRRAGTSAATDLEGPRASVPRLT